MCTDSPVQSLFLLHPAPVPVEETRANKGGGTLCGLQKEMNLLPQNMLEFWQNICYKVFAIILITILRKTPIIK